MIYSDCPRVRGNFATPCRFFLRLVRGGCVRFVDFFEQLHRFPGNFCARRYTATRSDPPLNEKVTCARVSVCGECVSLPERDCATRTQSQRGHPRCLSITPWHGIRDPPCDLLFATLRVRLATKKKLSLCARCNLERIPRSFERESETFPWTTWEIRCLQKNSKLRAGAQMMSGVDLVGYSPGYSNTSRGIFRFLIDAEGELRISATVLYFVAKRK